MQCTDPAADSSCESKAHIVLRYQHTVPAEDSMQHAACLHMTPGKPSQQAPAGITLIQKRACEQKGATRVICSLSPDNSLTRPSATSCSASRHRRCAVASASAAPLCASVSARCCARRFLSACTSDVNNGSLRN